MNTVITLCKNEMSELNLFLRTRILKLFYSERTNVLQITGCVPSISASLYSCPDNLYRSLIVKSFQKNVCM